MQSQCPFGFSFVRLPLFLWEFLYCRNISSHLPHFSLCTFESVTTTKAWLLILMWIWPIQKAEVKIDLFCDSGNELEPAWYLPFYIYLCASFQRILNISEAAWSFDKERCIKALLQSRSFRTGGLSVLLKEQPDISPGQDWYDRKKKDFDCFHILVLRLSWTFCQLSVGEIDKTTAHQTRLQLKTVFIIDSSTNYFLDWSLSI